ncbi:hypothetical protein [Bacillus cereus group sp. BfR-BA-01347]|uniref:hypothetical protein n=1 Tax=Bacillus cereus group sp. BfR-BA-01347 TaxID=2920310 RepID=UPI001F596B79|nr:hypothetical protein [Bacillus cereus group sp. BfR-BA-01347]
MAKTTRLVLEHFPQLEKHIHAYENLFTSQQAFESLNTEEERVFLEMIWFFEKPEENSFDMRLLYKYLNDERLVFGLDLLSHYFKYDTYLIRNVDHSLILSAEDYVTQSEFGRLLQGEGLNYNQRKIAMYRKRGKFVKEDVTVAGVPYWSKDTVQKYIDELLRKNVIGYKEDKTASYTVDTPVEYEEDNKGEKK